jgi:hypothetical protein
MFPRKLTVITEANIEVRREQLCGYVEILRNLKVSAMAAALLEDFLSEKHEVHREKKHAAIKARQAVNSKLAFEDTPKKPKGTKGKASKPAGMSKSWAAFKNAFRASHQGKSTRGIKVGSDKQLGYLLVIEPDCLASEKELHKMTTHQSTPHDIDELFLNCDPLSADFTKRLKDIDDINDRRQALPRQVMNLIERLKEYFIVEFNEEMREDLFGNETGEKVFYICIYVTETVLVKYAEEMGLDKMLKPFSIPGDWDAMSLKSLSEQRKQELRMGKGAKLETERKNIYGGYMDFTEARADLAEKFTYADFVSRGNNGKGQSKNVLRPNTRRVKSMGKSSSDFYEEMVVNKTRNDEVVSDTFDTEEEEDNATRERDHTKYGGLFAKPQWFHGRDDETLFSDRERLAIIWWIIDEKCNILVEFGKAPPEDVTPGSPSDWFFVRWKHQLVHSVGKMVEFASILNASELAGKMSVRHHTWFDPESYDAKLLEDHDRKMRRKGGSFSKWQDGDSEKLLKRHEKFIEDIDFGLIYFNNFSPIHDPYARFEFKKQWAMIGHIGHEDIEDLRKRRARELRSYYRRKYPGKRPWFVYFRTLWSTLFKLVNHQPLESIRNYFGGEIAIYFMFMGHLVSYLGYATFFGIVFTLIIYRDIVMDPEAFDRGEITLTSIRPTFEVSLAYTFILISWGFLMMEYWKRTQAMWAHKWNLSALVNEQKDRPPWVRQYRSAFGHNMDVDSNLASVLDAKTSVPTQTARRGKDEDALAGDPVDDEDDVKEVMTGPARVRQLTMAIQIISMVIVVILVAGTIVIRIILQVYVQATMTKDTPAGLPKYNLILNLTGALNGVIIVAAGAIYKKTAEVLTNWENWRTEEQAEAALISKRFTFEFVNSYISMFFIAFVKPFIGTGLTELMFPNGYAEVTGYKRYYIEESHCMESNCMYELAIQLMSILFIKSMGKKIVKALTDPIMSLVGILMSIIKFSIRIICPCMKREAKDASGRAKLSKKNKFIELESDKAWYIIEDKRKDYEGALDNYTEMAIVYGYIVLFASAFPLAPAISVITTFFECRLDASELLKSKRPKPMAVQSIGNWQSVFEILTVCGVFTNIGLIVFTDNQFYWLSPAGKLGMVLFLEHFTLGMRAVIMNLIPDEPIAVKKSKFFLSKKYEWLHKSIKYADFDYTTGKGVNNWCSKTRCKEQDILGRSHMNETQMNAYGLQNLREHERKNDLKRMALKNHQNKDAREQRSSPGGNDGMARFEAVDDLGAMLTHGGISFPHPMSLSLHEQTFGLVDLNKEQNGQELGHISNETNYFGHRRSPSTPAPNQASPTVNWGDTYV